MNLSMKSGTVLLLGGAIGLWFLIYGAMTGAPGLIVLGISIMLIVLMIDLWLHFKSANKYRYRVLRYLPPTAYARVKQYEWEMVNSTVLRGRFVTGPNTLSSYYCPLEAALGLHSYIMPYGDSATAGVGTLREAILTQWGDWNNKPPPSSAKIDLAVREFTDAADSGKIRPEELPDLFKVCS